MKKLWMILALCLILAGCGSAETFETLGQVQHELEELAAMGTVQLTLPESASKEVFANNGDTMYDCGDYTLTVQTLSGGDFSRTVQTLCGFSVNKLTVMESGTGKTGRYEWVWTAAGEGGDVLCRAAVLDDGNYHYCLCVIAPAQNAGALQEEWTELFQSFCLT